MTALLETGVVDDLPDVEYHAHPALSSSGARKLLPPSCPARFRWERDNPPESTRTLDFGKAAHRVVLDRGADLLVVDADDWRTNAAKAQRDEAHATGRTPLLREEMRVVEDMAAAIRKHPVASVLFNPDRGRPEQSLFWTDPTTAVDCRARLDWLPDPSSGRLIIPDLKTSQSAQPDAFAKSCASYGYAQQSAWYIDGAKQLGLAEEVAFVFVVIEKTPPYLVTVCELDWEALRIGARLNWLAREVYADCQANDTWPSYTDEVAHIQLPGWYLRQHEDIAS